MGKLNKITRPESRIELNNSCEYISRGVIKIVLHNLIAASHRMDSRGASSDWRSVETLKLAIQIRKNRAVFPSFESVSDEWGF